MSIRQTIQMNMSFVHLTNSIKKNIMITEIVCQKHVEATAVQVKNCAKSVEKYSSGNY